MRRPMILAAVLSVMLTACGGGGGEASNLATEPPGGSEGQGAAEGDTITGKLGGDPQLEGGCAWVDDGRTRWQVQYPDDYRLTLEPLSLTGPGGLDAGEGDTITVTGSEQGDAMTTCQVGPVWIATSVTAGR